MAQFMCEKLMSSTLSCACPLNRRNVTRLTLDLQSLSVVLGVGSEIFARSADCCAHECSPSSPTQYARAQFISRARTNCTVTQLSLRSLHLNNGLKRKKEDKQYIIKMSCCSTHTAEARLEPYQLRALYIRQICRFAHMGIFREALNVFKEVSMLFNTH